MSDILFAPAPHAEAAAFIKDKPVVAREVFDRLLPEVRARTFMVSGQVPLDVAQKLRDRIADLPQGGDWNAIKRDVADSLSPFLGSGDPANAEADRAAAERRAELLLRTHGYQAYSAAQYQVMDRQRDVFPYWRYQTAQDDRVRDSHAALEGKVLPADDPFWQTHFPPWDFNCRCTVVPLSRGDVEEIQAADKSLPPEQRSILSADQRTRMNRDGTLLTGPNERVDVRSPREKRDGDGYAWTPGDLRLPLSTLKERYSPEVFAAFEDYARTTKLDDGRSIYGWLIGETAQAPAAPAKRQPSAPTPQLARQSSVSPVSRVFDLPASRSSAKPTMSAALAAIDAVHDDGTLPAMTLTGRPVSGALGHFDHAQREIAVSPGGPWPQMTAAHEVGHLIDFFALGEAGAFASEAHPALAAWRAAVAASAPVKALQGEAGAALPPRARSYLLRHRELWARSYAQYVAQRSGSAELLRQLDKARAGATVGQLTQWRDADFAPIAAAIDELFRTKGWRA